MNPAKHDRIKLRLTVDVEYDLGGEMPDDIRQNLAHLPERAAGDGILSWGNATVSRWERQCREFRADPGVQAVRFLAEIYAEGLTPNQTRAIAQSMDCTEFEIKSMMRQIDEEWDRLKPPFPGQDGPSLDEVLATMDED